MISSIIIKQMEIKDPILRDIILNSNSQVLPTFQKVNYPVYDKNKDYKNRFFSLSGGMETIRILPPLEGKAIKRTYLHIYKVDGKTLKLHCLKHNDGEYCPFCEWSDKLVTVANKKKETLLKSTGSGISQDEKQKVLQPVNDLISLSLVYKAKPFYVVELIRRRVNQYGKYIEGSLLGKKEFWCFSEHYKENGPLEMLIRLGKQFGDLSHAFHGRDLTLVSVNNKNNYSELVNIIVNEPSPLFGSDNEYNILNNDNFSWRDIYKPKTVGNISPADYLLAVRDNKLPYWDSERKSWIIPGSENKTATNHVGHAVSMKQAEVDEVL